MNKWDSREKHKDRTFNRFLNLYDMIDLIVLYSLDNDLEGRKEVYYRAKTLVKQMQKEGLIV